MAKTIFNSSESSNFILNMTEEKYSKLASTALCLSCILISLFTIPSELLKNTGSSIASAGLAVCGVACMITALIAVLKKYITKSMLIPVSAFGFMLVWGVISLINSFNTNSSFYGYNGRGEGLLAIIFYFCFFITAMSITKTGAIRKVFDAIVIMGALNSVWGLLQIFDFFGVIGSDISSFYKYIPATGNVNAASGLSQSPIFLAMTLSLALVTAIIGACSDENKKRRILYTISAIVFSFVIMFTYTIVGVVGVTLSIIAGIITVIVKKGSLTSILKIVGIAVGAALAIILAITNVVGDSGKYNLYDGNLMWSDSYNRLSTSGIYDIEKVDIKDTADVYKYLSKNTIDIVKEYPLVGTGPENLIYPQLKESYKPFENPGTFDKNYNEYLYTAATRGLPSLAALIVIFVSVIAAGILKLRKKCNMLLLTSFMLAVTGMIILLISNSNITFSPIFWICAGFCVGTLKPEIEKKSKLSKAKK